MTFNSDDLNFLVFRYLEEAGFRHTAYVFGNESHITHSNIDGTMVPAGGLVTLLQKALLYTEAELLAMKDEEDGPEVEKMVDSLSLIEAVMPNLPFHKVRKRKAPGAGPMKPEMPSSSSTPNPATTSSSGQIAAPQAQHLRNANGSAATLPLHRKVGGFDPMKYPANSQPSASTSAANAVPQQLGNHHLRPTPANGPPAPHHHHMNMERFLNGAASSSAKLKTGAAATALNLNNGSNNGERLATGRPEVETIVTAHNGELFEIERSRVSMLTGHESEVFMCAWNPKHDIIASGSGDSTARIWDLSEGPVQAQNRSRVLKHALKGNDEPNRNKDVTSLDWNASGKLLATGCYDGQARVWTADGDLQYTSSNHNGPIFALKWNPNGTLVLSAGVDKSTIIWNPVSNCTVQTFTFHTNSALDVDWISDDMFASCSTDQNIHVCKIGADRPIKTFSGHSNEVNAIRYDPKSKLLASCSDDMSLKIWSLEHEKALFNLKMHAKEIYTIRWSPAGKIIASASFDHTVKLWDATTGTLQRSLEKHTDPVYSVGFSPCGKYVASGSFDRCVLLWDVATGKHLMTYRGGDTDGGIFDVGFNSDGTKIGASASDGKVLVLDLRYMKSPMN
ncbi:hypothetical protein QR680_016864 [Steinernema hermaphroditum]|uniref:LisH domain-containing protein n=1 Tax=Steinernema hermaphroditum TaxID=289476 RepID=A0AA39HDM3_9BILA|nr:hypothetical protein QR680_016864 [Steinernema hermaphroditum]